MTLRIAIPLACAAFALGGRAEAGILLQNATATFSQTGYTIGRAIDGIYSTGSYNNEGWAIGNVSRPYVNDSQTAAFETAADVGFAGGTALTFTLFGGGNYGYGGTHHLGRFRLSATTAGRDTFADGLATGGDVDTAWTILTPSLAASSRAATSLAILGDGSILAAGASNGELETYTISVYTLLQGITGFRLEALADPSLPTDGPGRASNGNFMLREFAVEAAAVPEPASLALLASGLIGLLVCGRKRGPSRA